MFYFNWYRVFEIVTTFKYFTEILKTSSILVMFKHEIQVLYKEFDVKYEVCIFIFLSNRLNKELQINSYFEIEELNFER